MKKNVPDVLNLEFEDERGSNMRKITFGHLGLPFGHQAPRSCDHQTPGEAQEARSAGDVTM